MYKNNIYKMNSNLNNQNKDQIKLLSVDVLKKSHEFLFEILSKSCKEGLLDLNEAFNCKLALANFEACIENINKYQTTLMDANKRMEESKKEKPIDLNEEDDLIIN